jgi:hypothetical protein
LESNAGGFRSLFAKQKVAFVHGFRIFYSPHGK